MKREIIYDYKPRTKFQALLKKMGIDETFTVPHLRQTKFNKFINNVPLYADYNCMVDLLLLPITPSGNRYLLTALDLGTNKCDFEPMKTKTAKECLSALKTIFSRNYVKEPEFSISTDGGTEFKSEFDKFCVQKSIYHKVAMPYRHSQQAPIEAFNKTMSRILMGYLNEKMLETKEEQTDWEPILEKCRKQLNKYRERKNLDELRLKQPMFNPNLAGEPDFEVGQFVHYQLNRPMDALNQPLSGEKFRKGDMRYSATVHQIEKILMMNDYPYYRYVLSDLKSVSFAAEQLLPAQKEEKTYLVKKIIDHGMKDRVLHYKVWWKGYLRKDATWHPATELIQDDLQDHIDEYKESLKAKKAKAKKKR